MCIHCFLIARLLQVERPPLVSHLALKPLQVCYSFSLTLSSHAHTHTHTHTRTHIHTHAHTYTHTHQPPPFFHKTTTPFLTYSPVRWSVSMATLIVNRGGSSLATSLPTMVTLRMLWVPPQHTWFARRVTHR